MPLSMRSSSEEARIHNAARRRNGVAARLSLLKNPPTARECLPIQIGLD
jgi:hypothetical protein